MIDEKKIEEAAELQLDALGSYGLNEDEIGRIGSMVLYREEDVKKSFEAGINWFLCNLWRKKDELPDETTSVLVKLKNGEIYSSYRIGESFYITNAEDGYEVCVGINEVTRWLYLDDLLKGKTMASCPYDSKQFCTLSDGRYCYNEHPCTEGYREVNNKQKNK